MWSIGSACGLCPASLDALASSQIPGSFSLGRDSPGLKGWGTSTVLSRRGQKSIYVLCMHTCTWEVASVVISP